MGGGQCSHLRAVASSGQAVGMTRTRKSATAAPAWCCEPALCLLAATCLSRGACASPCSYQTPSDIVLDADIDEASSDYFHRYRPAQANSSTRCSASRLVASSGTRPNPLWCRQLRFYRHKGRLSPGPPATGLDYSAHRAASTTSLVRSLSDARTTPCPSIAPALRTACCLRSRLAGCSSFPPRITTISSSPRASPPCRAHICPLTHRAPMRV